MAAQSTSIRWICKKCGYGDDSGIEYKFCPMCGNKSDLDNENTDEGDAKNPEGKKTDPFGKVSAIPEGRRAQKKNLRITKSGTIEPEVKEPKDPGKKNSKPEGVEQKTSETDNVSETKRGKSHSVSPWHGWANIPSGHKMASVAMLSIKENVESFKNRLEAARLEYNSKLEANKKNFDASTQDIKKVCDEKRKDYESKYNGYIYETQRKKRVVEDSLIKCREFVWNIAPYSSKSNINATNENMIIVSEAEQKVLDAINSKMKAYTDLYNMQKSEIDKYFNDKTTFARDVKMQADSTALSKYKRLTETEGIQEMTDLVKEGFNSLDIKEYLNEVSASRFDANNYKCPTELPDFIKLGIIGMSLPYKTEEEKKAVNVMNTQANNIGFEKEGLYFYTLPYTQSISDGISLLMKYEPKYREAVQSLMQPLLLNLFMSIPAGKLEATIIDPLEIGASFPDIPKLAEGPNSARIIDTKIWSKEKDIEAAVARLRQRLENVTQAYGGDKKSMLKKEVIRALAITDFPVGFNETALKDLNAIVRNSAALGVCVFISANEEELLKLKERNGSLVNEISQSLIQTKAVGDKLVFTESESKGLFLIVDTLWDAIEKKDQIIPIIRSEIDHAQLKIEHFSSMYKGDIYDHNTWFRGNKKEINIPLGIKGADTVVKMVLGRGGGSTEHHALIAGPTGAGKSTLLHTLILSTLISYRPDEVQMYLLDFKEGVEFSDYTHYRLPSLRVVALNSEREFGLNVLRELCTELESRTKHFSRYGVSDINSYNELGRGPKVPKLLLIFDEVQELFRSKGDGDDISSECLSCINKLVMQGRAMGIHIILACQDFHNCSGIEAYFSQMVIRIAVKGSEDGAASILSSDNNGIKTLQNQQAGAAIYNGGGGVESANNFFQISYITKDERVKLLKELGDYYSSSENTDYYNDKQTRILLTNAEENIHNCFNKLINNGISSFDRIGSSSDSYGMLLGQGYGRNSIFTPELSCQDGENLLVVTPDEKMAMGLFELATMSFLYEELGNNVDKIDNLVNIVDLNACYLTEDESDFEYLGNQFSEQIKVANVRNIDSIINETYEKMMRRADGEEPCQERVFLMIFGLNRARKLKSSRMYDNDYDDKISTLEMLNMIIRKGPRFKINCIVWGESYSGIEYIMGDGFESLFEKRIAYDLDPDTMNELVAESFSKSIKGKTAVYMDIGKDVTNTHFRPYDVPAKEWIKQYSQAYNKAVKENN